MKVLVRFDSKDEIRAAVDLAYILKDTLIHLGLYSGSIDANIPVGTVGICLKENAKQILENIKKEE